MKRGSLVKQIVKPVAGMVTKFQIDQETGDKLVEVTWTDELGEVHARFFKESELEVTSEQ